MELNETTGIRFDPAASAAVIAVAVLSALCAVASTACSDSTPGDGGTLGQSCTSSADCGADLVCQAGTCRDPDAQQTADGASDADPGGDGSAPQDDADNHSDADDVPFDTCAAVSVEFTPVVPTVLLLVDRSGSMVEDFGGVTRWQAVQDVLFGAQADDPDAVVRRYEQAVRFGLVTYNSEDGFLDGGTCPILTGTELVPALGNADAMAAELGATMPSGDTPTGEAIDATVPLFAAVAERAPRVLLLATDGEPDTCAVPDPQQGQPESVAAVQDALLGGIRTYVLSVGSEIGEPHLQDLANAGVGLALDGPEQAPFWKADDPAALGTAVRDIVTGSRPCVFGINGQTVSAAEAARAIVELTDSETMTTRTLTLDDPSDGWVLHSTAPPCFGAGQCVELLGAACETVQNDPAPGLRARFPCE